jgi:hydantoinase/carbamoylase family amidase
MPPLCTLGHGGAQCSLRFILCDGGRRGILRRHPNHLCRVGHSAGVTTQKRGMAVADTNVLGSVAPRVERVEEDLAALGAIGALAGGGMARLAWTDEEFAAKAFLEARLRGLGLRPARDAASNVWADIGPSGSPVLMIGSHLDTVPSGGRYDGALGVLGGLEVLRLLAEAGRPLRRRVRLCAFTDEEGARFGTGLFGSTAVAGDLDMEHLASVRDVGGSGLDDAMTSRGLRLQTLRDASATLDGVEAYLELHIEQGPRLERMGRDVGLVTAITGIRQVQYTFQGEANHAGTTALTDRRDALLPAAETVVEVRRAAERTGGRAVATVGYLRPAPGAANVVPGETTMSVEVRSPESDVADGVHADIARAAEVHARAHGAEIVREVRHHVAPAAMDDAWRARLRRQVEAIGETPVDLVSWAGHDAGALATRIPVAMLFVPSRAGLSHTPAEYTAPERYRAGLEAFARTVSAWAWDVDG